MHSGDKEDCMIDQSIRTKIKKIKIHTKRIMQSTLSGDYLSAFKGSGLEFHQIREYSPGDDVRAIDWNNSAKINKIMVKQFIEERDRTIILAIDVSGSNAFSSQESLRQDTISELASTLTFIASASKDHVGALFFSDVIEAWIPPAKGQSHTAKIIETIYTLKAKNKKTDIAAALRFLIATKKRNAVVFFISDWIDDMSRCQNLLKVARCKFDLVSIRVLDRTEISVPGLGFLDIQNPEDGTMVSINTHNASTTHHPLSTFLNARLLAQKRLFEKFKIDLLDLPIAEPFINKLMSFFHQRIKRQV